MEDECLKPDNFHADPGPAFSPAEHSLRSGVVMNWPPREYRMARAFIRNIIGPAIGAAAVGARSEEHTSELQSLMRISYAVFCLKKKNKTIQDTASTPSII